MYVESEGFDAEGSELGHFGGIASCCVDVHAGFVKGYCEAALMPPSEQPVMRTVRLRVDITLLGTSEKEVFGSHRGRYK